jgi:hypothetical protein
MKKCWRLAEKYWRLMKKCWRPAGKYWRPKNGAKEKEKIRNQKTREDN